MSESNNCTWAIFLHFLELLLECICMHNYAFKNIPFYMLIGLWYIVSKLTYKSNLTVIKFHKYVHSCGITNIYDVAHMCVQTCFASIFTSDLATRYWHLSFVSLETLYNCQFDNLDGYTAILPYHTQRSRRGLWKTSPKTSHWMTMRQYWLDKTNFIQAFSYFNKLLQFFWKIIKQTNCMMHFRQA